MVRTVLFLMLILPLMAASLARGISYRVVADEVLADQADVIVQGRVVGSTVRVRDDRIVTRYAVEPFDMVKGTAVAERLRVEVLGGHLPDGRFLHIPGSASFDVGQEVLLFLRRTPERPLRILHVMQGAFYKIENGGGFAWFRHFDEGALPTKGTAEGQSSLRDAAGFVAWLRDRATGETRVPDYHRPVADDGAAALAKFTLLGGDDNPPHLRWFVFDEGGRVRWMRHQGGQPGSADGGASAFSAARRAWNSEPDTPVRYRDGGTTNSRAGFGQLDGLTTILFRDFADDIGTDYNCSQGGTLAVGGVHGVASFTPRTWNGRPFLETVEAEVVINNGVACFADNNRDLEELYTHELGHSLGLGHSCGDSNSPPCSSDVRLFNAVMRASFPLASSGAVLRADDIDGIRFLYQPGGDVPCNLDVGTGRYCTDCGLCSEGQGDCDNDDECSGTLVCRDNVGASFGFSPGTDVCVAGNGPPPPPPPGGGTCQRSNGDPRLCSDPDCAPCANGEGDCDNDAECAAGLACVDNVGAMFGFAPGIDVCIGCPETLGSGRYCSACGPCAAGEGDCDNDAECAAGLTCVDNIGAMFGFAPGVDVCQ